MKGHNSIFFLTFSLLIIMPWIAFCQSNDQICKFIQIQSPFNNTSLSPDTVFDQVRINLIPDNFQISVLPNAMQKYSQVSQNEIIFNKIRTRELPSLRLQRCGKNFEKKGYFLILADFSQENPANLIHISHSGLFDNDQYEEIPYIENYTPNIIMKNSLRENNQNQIISLKVKGNYPKNAQCIAYVGKEFKKYKLEISQEYPNYLCKIPQEIIQTDTIYIGLLYENKLNTQFVQIEVYDLSSISKLNLSAIYPNKISYNSLQNMPILLNFTESSELPSQIFIKFSDEISQIYKATLINSYNQNKIYEIKEKPLNFPIKFGSFSVNSYDFYEFENKPEIMILPNPTITKISLLENKNYIKIDGIGFTEDSLCFINNTRKVHAEFINGNEILCKINFLPQNTDNLASVEITNDNISFSNNLFIFIPKIQEITENMNFAVKKIYVENSKENSGKIVLTIGQNYDIIFKLNQSYFSNNNLMNQEKFACVLINENNEQISAVFIDPTTIKCSINYDKKSENNILELRNSENSLYQSDVILLEIPNIIQILQNEHLLEISMSDFSMNYALFCYINETFVQKAEFKNQKFVCDLPEKIKENSQEISVKLSYDGLKFSNENTVFIISKYDLEIAQNNLLDINKILDYNDLLNNGLKIFLTDILKTYLKYGNKKIQAIYSIHNENYTNNCEFLQSELSIICLFPYMENIENFEFYLLIDNHLLKYENLIQIEQSKISILKVFPQYFFTNSIFKYQRIMLSNKIINRTDLLCKYTGNNGLFSQVIFISDNEILCEIPYNLQSGSQNLQILNKNNQIIAEKENSLIVFADFSYDLASNFVNPYLQFIAELSIIPKESYLKNDFIFECICNSKENLYGISVQGIYNNQKIFCNFTYEATKCEKLSMNFYYKSYENPIISNQNEFSISQIPQLNFIKIIPDSINYNENLIFSIYGQNFNYAKNINVFINNEKACTKLTKNKSDTEILLEIYENCLSKENTQIFAEFSYEDNQKITKNTGLFIKFEKLTNLSNFEILPSQNIILFGEITTKILKCKIRNSQISYEISASQLSQNSILCNTKFIDEILSENQLFISVISEKYTSNEIPIKIQGYNFKLVSPRVYIFPMNLADQNIYFTNSVGWENMLYKMNVDEKYKINCEGNNTNIWCNLQNFTQDLISQNLVENYNEINVKIYSEQILFTEQQNFIIPFIRQINFVAINPKSIYRNLFTQIAISCFPKISDYLINNMNSLKIFMKVYPDNTEFYLNDFTIKNPYTIEISQEIFKNISNTTSILVFQLFFNNIQISSPIQLPILSLDSTQPNSQQILFDINKTLTLSDLAQLDILPEFTLNSSIIINPKINIENYYTNQAQLLSIPRISQEKLNQLLQSKISKSYIGLPKISYINPNIILINEKQEFSILVQGNNIISQQNTECIIEILGQENSIKFQSSDILFINSNSIICKFTNIQIMPLFSQSNNFLNTKIFLQIQAGISNSVDLFFAKISPNSVSLLQPNFTINYEISQANSLDFIMSNFYEKAPLFCIFEKYGASEIIRKTSNSQIIYSCKIPKIILGTLNQEIIVNLLSLSENLYTQKIILTKKMFPQTEKINAKIPYKNEYPNSKYSEILYGYEIIDYSTKIINSEKIQVKMNIKSMLIENLNSSIKCAFLNKNLLEFSDIEIINKNEISCEINNFYEKVCISLYSQNIKKYLSKSICLQNNIKCPQISTINPDILLASNFSQNLIMQISNDSENVPENTILVLQAKNENEFYSTLKYIGNNMFAVNVNPLILNYRNIGNLLIFLRNTNCESNKILVKIENIPKVSDILPKIIWNRISTNQKISHFIKFEQKISANLAPNIKFRYKNQNTMQNMKFNENYTIGNTEFNIGNTSLNLPEKLEIYVQNYLIFAMKFNEFISFPEISIFDKIWTGQNYFVKISIPNLQSSNILKILESAKILLNIFNGNSFINTFTFSHYNLTENLLYFIGYELSENMRFDIEINISDQKIVSNRISGIKYYKTAPIITKYFPEIIEENQSTDLKICIQNTESSHIYAKIKEINSCNLNVFTDNIKENIEILNYEISSGCYKFSNFMVKNNDTKKILLQITYDNNENSMKSQEIMIQRIPKFKLDSIITPFYIQNIRNPIQVKFAQKIESCKNIKFDGICGNFPCETSNIYENNTIQLQPFYMNSNEIQVGLLNSIEKYKFEIMQIPVIKIIDFSYYFGSKYIDSQNSLKISFLLENSANFLNIQNFMTAQLNIQPYGTFIQNVVYNSENKFIEIMLPDRVNEIFANKITDELFVFSCEIYIEIDKFKYKIGTLEFIKIPPIKIQQISVIQQNYISIYGQNLNMLKSCQSENTKAILPIIFNNSYAECGPLQFLPYKNTEQITLKTAYDKILEFSINKGINYELYNVSPTEIYYPMINTEENNYLNINFKIQPDTNEKLMCTLKSDIGNYTGNALKNINGTYFLQKLDLIKILPLISSNSQNTHEISIQCFVTDSPNNRIPYKLLAYNVPRMTEFYPAIFFSNLQYSVNSSCYINFENKPAIDSQQFSFRVKLKTNLTKSIDLIRKSDTQYEFLCKNLNLVEILPIQSSFEYSDILLYGNGQYLQTSPYIFGISKSLEILNIRIVESLQPVIYLTLSELNWLKYPISQNIIDSSLSSPIKLIIKNSYSSNADKSYTISQDCKIKSPEIMCEFNRLSGYFDDLELDLGAQFVKYKLPNPINKTRIIFANSIIPENVLISEQLIFNLEPAQIEYCEIPLLNARIKSANKTICDLTNYKSKIDSLLFGKTNLVLPINPLDEFGQNIGTGRTQITIWNMPILSNQIYPSVIQYDLPTILTLQGQISSPLLNFLISPYKIPLSIISTNSTHIKLKYDPTLFAIKEFTNFADLTSVLALSVNSQNMINTQIQFTISQSSKPTVKQISRTLFFRSATEQRFTIYGNNFKKYPKETMKIIFKSGNLEFYQSEHIFINSNTVVIKFNPTFPPDTYFISVSNYEGGDFSIEQIFIKILEKPTYTGPSLYSLSLNSDTVLSLPFSKLPKPNSTDDWYYGCIAQDQPLTKDESDLSLQGFIQCRFGSWGLPNGISNVSVYFVYDRFSLDLIGNFSVKITPSVKLQKIISGRYIPVSIGGNVRIKGSNFVRGTTFCRFVSNAMQNEAKTYARTNDKISVYDYYMNMIYPAINATFISDTEILCNTETIQDLTPDNYLIIVTNNEPLTRPLLEQMQHVELGSSTLESEQLVISTYWTIFAKPSRVSFDPNIIFNVQDADIIVTEDGNNADHYNGDYMGIPANCELMSKSNPRIITEIGCAYINSGMNSLVLKLKKNKLNEGEYYLRMKFDDTVENSQILHDGSLTIVETPGITKIFPDQLISGTNAKIYVFGLNFRKLPVIGDTECVLYPANNSTYRYKGSAQIIDQTKLFCTFGFDFAKLNSSQSDWIFSILYKGIYVPLITTVNSLKYQANIQIINPLNFARKINQSVISLSSNAEPHFIEISGTISQINSPIIKCRYTSFPNNFVIEKYAVLNAKKTDILLCPIPEKDDTLNSETLMKLQILLIQSDSGIFMHFFTS